MNELSVIFILLARFLVPIIVPIFVILLVRKILNIIFKNEK